MFCFFQIINLVQTINLPDLRKLAKNLKLKHTGKRAPLIERISTPPLNGIKYNLSESRKIALKKFQCYRKAESASEMHTIIMNSYPTWCPYKIKPQTNASWINKISRCIEEYGEVAKLQRRKPIVTVSDTDESSSDSADRDESQSSINNAQIPATTHESSSTTADSRNLETQLTWMSTTYKEVQEFLIAKQGIINDINSRAWPTNMLPTLIQHINAYEFNQQLLLLAKLQAVAKAVIDHFKPDSPEGKQIASKICNISQQWRNVQRDASNQLFTLTTFMDFLKLQQLLKTNCAPVITLLNESTHLDGTIAK